jgi:uncharacterized protein (UPF0297 family)
MPSPNYDFSGWATKNGLKCSDGRTILRDAFKDQDGMTVPLVWRHLHDELSNILGHAELENRADGVYVYAYLNESAEAVKAKSLIEHKDILSLSIFANQLIEKAKNVIHGTIREVSLVLSGANPGAKIDFIAVQHGDGEPEDLDDEAIIYTGLELIHGDAEEESEEDKKARVAKEKAALEHEEEETLADVFETLDEKQATAVYAIIGQLLESGEIEHTAEEEKKLKEGAIKKLMKKNVFDNRSAEVEPILSHSDFKAILKEGQRLGSLREGFNAHIATLDEKTQELVHAGTFGIDNIDYLFPDARNVTKEPTWIARRMGWVKDVMGGVRHSPFSRIKSMHANITADEARAKGYTTGDLKIEEVFPILRRTTTPTTIYKKQKLDRDDIIDITDFNVVAWLKREMRVLLDEEIARAILVGDGRDGASDDKISETEVRPIWLEDTIVYIHQEIAAFADGTVDLIDDIISMRVEYRGSGSPKCYMAPSLLTAMLLLKDNDLRRMYRSVQELAAELRVSEIVEVPAMEGLVHTPDATEYALRAIVVNLSDYTVGADKGGEINMFDDFDIDYNQQKYLIETRISGALTVPKSALILEQLTS